jgi:PKD repeat protein
LTKDISVQPTPNVSFSSSYDGINNQMNFTDQSTIPSGSNASFEWLFGDNTSSNDQNLGHTYANSGAYYVTLTVTSAVGCVGTANQQIVVPVGVEEQSMLRLGVYPNPTSETITFNSPLTGSCCL